MRHWLRRPAAFALFAALCLAAAVAQPASAQEAPARPKIVAPLLDALRFGDTVGLTLACSTALSFAGNAAGSDAALAQAVGPVLSELSTGCATFSTLGAEFIDSTKEGTIFLNGLNPLLDPVLQSFTDTLGATVTTAKTSDVPFADTLEESAALLAWLGS